MKRQKMLAMFLAAQMSLSLLPSPVYAALKDENLGWAKTSIERWNGCGVLNGDEQGLFHPQSNMTRAELATMLANMLGYTEVGENVFADVPADAWYADAILKLAAAGVMKGSDGLARPNDPISREEATVMLFRALNLETEAGAGTGFSDDEEIAAWAREAIAALVSRDMIHGVGGNRFAPQISIDRASVAQLMDNMVSHYITEDGAVITGEVKGVVIVAAKNVTFRDAVLQENVILSPAASGKITLENVSSQGKLLVSAADVQLEGDRRTQLKELVVCAGGTKVRLAGKTQQLTVDEKAGKTSLKLQDGAVVEQMTNGSAGLSILGSGTVKELTVTGGRSIGLGWDVNIDRVHNETENQIYVGSTSVGAGANPVEPGQGHYNPDPNPNPNPNPNPDPDPEPDPTPQWTQHPEETGAVAYTWTHSNVAGESNLTALVDKLTWQYPNAASFRITLDASTSNAPIVDPVLEYNSEDYFGVARKPLELIFIQPSENHTVTITGSTNQKIILQDSGAGASGYHQSKLILNLPNAQVDSHLWMDSVEVQAVQSLKLLDQTGSLQAASGTITLTNAAIQLTDANSILRLRDLEKDENRYTLIGTATLNQDWNYGTDSMLDVGYNVSGQHTIAGALTIKDGVTLTIQENQIVTVYGTLTVAKQTDKLGIHHAGSGKTAGRLIFDTDGHVINRLTMGGISLADIRSADSTQKNWFNTPTTLNECVVTLDDGDYIDQLGGAAPAAIFTSKLDSIILRGLKNLDFRLSQNTALNGDFAFGTGDSLNLYQSWIIMGDGTALTFSGDSKVTLEDALGPMSDRFMLGTNAKLIFRDTSTMTGFQKTQGTSTIMPIQAMDKTGRLTVNENVLKSLTDMEVVNFSTTGTYLYRFDPSIERDAWIHIDG